MRRFLAVLAVLSLISTACGGTDAADPAEDPKRAVVDAFETLNDDGLGITMSLDSDEESLTALLAADEETGAPPEMIDLMLDATFTVRGNGAQEVEDSASEMVFAIGDEPVVELVGRGVDLYARADVPAIVKAVGEDPGSIEAGLEGLPSDMSYVRDLVDGEWLKLTGLEEFLGTMGTDPSEAAAQQQEMAAAFGELFEEHATFETGDEEGPGTHIEIRAPLRPLAEGFLDISAESGTMPSGAMGGQQFFDAALEQLPEGDVIVDSWVEDGELTQLRLDLLENFEEFGAASNVPEEIETLGLMLAFDPSYEPELEVPDDAVEVDFNDVMQQFLTATAVSPGTSTEVTTPGSGEPGDPCEVIADLPKAQQEAYKDICPDL